MKNLKEQYPSVLLNITAVRQLLKWDSILLENKRISTLCWTTDGSGHNICKKLTIHACQSERINTFPLA